MGLLQRYFNLFDGEPVWLILLVSVILMVGLLVIVEKALRLGTWLLIVGLVAGLVMVVGTWILFR